MSWIYSSLTEEKMSEIISLSTTANVWDSFCKSYSFVSTTRVISLKYQLQQIKKTGLSATQYLAKIKDVDYLAAIGEPVALKDHVSHILEGFGPEYLSFLTYAAPY